MSDEMELTRCEARGKQFFMQVIEHELKFDANRVFWQLIEKEHVDPDNKLSDEEWVKFVAVFQNNFAEEFSEMVNNAFQQWIDEKPIEDLIEDGIKF